MTIELFPADAHNQKTINQGHPPGWINGDGGEYDLVVLGGGASRLGRRHHRGGRRAPRRADGAAIDRGNLCQFWLHAEQGAHPVRTRRLRCGQRSDVRLSTRRSAQDGLWCGYGTGPPDALPEQ